MIEKYIDGPRWKILGNKMNTLGEERKYFTLIINVQIIWVLRQSTGEYRTIIIGRLEVTLEFYIFIYNV